MTEKQVEPWLRGTFEEMDALRRGVLHALELAGEDAASWCSGLSGEEMGCRPLGLPSVGFQLRHIVRSLDRLLTYAEGGGLSEHQMELLRGELEVEGREASLMEFAEGLEVAMLRVRRFGPEMFGEARGVGRKRLPTTVGGLLVHCAEHTQRHVGQMVTTAKVVVAMRVSALVRV